MTNDEFFAELDALGVAEVEGRLATSVYLGAQAGLARAWLARQRESANAEQLALARRAAEEASAATQIARAAKQIAIASMIITIIGIAVGVIVPHFWH